ncbi:hypothetical protein DFAR_2330011 [Desulfarculales bacterium]
MEDRHGRRPKKRVTIFLFGVISDFFARDYMERSEQKRSLRDKCAQRWQPSLLARMAGAAAGPWTRTPPRPWSACAENGPLRQ